MKHLRLYAVVFALTAVVAASIAIACGDKTSATNTTAAASASSKQAPACCAMKGASATTASATKGAACTADMAAHCTPEMKAACAKGASASAASMASCPGMKGGASATTASMDHCAGMKGGASATTASMDHCAGMKNTAMAAGASCTRQGGVSAMAAGAGCAAHGNATTMAHSACDACEDMAMCEDDVRSSGARAKVVALKNGAMVVYTADTPENIRAVQTAVARRNDLLLASMKSGSDTKLCNDCRTMRGAMASGKLHREVVNVETGCMTLITSSDRAIVQKIHAMTGAQMAAHIKS